MSNCKQGLIKDDNTRQVILPLLEETGIILDALFDDLKLKHSKPIIVPQEDLGLANNVIRMSGGFFTGCYVSWECEEPFIPVDTTVNACGVSIFKLGFKCTVKDFKAQSKYVKNQYTEEAFNFVRGNHFISLCSDDNGNNYLVVHASDSAYKYGSNGLYPYRDSWYIPYIKTFAYGERYLRYIIGETAVRFYELYKEAEELNPIRNIELCEKMFGKKCWKEYIYSPHYGMPNMNSIAIGCQWKPGKKILLTTPGQDIYVFMGADQELYPHGFGMIQKNIQSISYKSGKLYINEKKIEEIESYIADGNLSVRFLDEKIDESFIRHFLGDKKFNLLTVLHQRAAWTREGFHTYE